MIDVKECILEMLDESDELDLDHDYLMQDLLDYISLEDLKRMYEERGYAGLYENYLELFPDGDDIDKNPMGSEIREEIYKKYKMSIRRNVIEPEIELYYVTLTAPDGTDVVNYCAGGADNIESIIKELKRKVDLGEI